MKLPPGPRAVGFDGARGDTVSVINSPFVVPAPLDDIPEPGLLEQDWIWQAAVLHWHSSLC